MQDILPRFPKIAVWAGEDNAAFGASKAIRQSNRKIFTVLASPPITKDNAGEYHYTPDSP